jgi:hypothetical protein
LAARKRRKHPKRWRPISFINNKSLTTNRGSGELDPRLERQE